MNQSNHRPLLLATLFCITFTIFLMGLSLFIGMLPASSERWAYGIAGCIAGGAALLLFAGTNRGQWRRFHLDTDALTPVRLFAGLAIGVVIACLLFAVLFGVDGLRLERLRANGIGGLLLALLPLLPLAFMEELGFRSYPLLVLHRRYGPWIALLVTAILFAIYHIVSGWDPLIAFLGPGTWAFVFGIGALRSGGIALATGIHWGANVTQLALGTKGAPAALFKIVEVRPGYEPWPWTGPLLQMALLAGSLALLFRYQSKRKLQAA